MSQLSADGRGIMTQAGNLMHVENALVEEVSFSDRSGGYLLISYAVPQRNGMTAIEVLRLNVGQNTVVLNSFGLPMCLCDIREGMRVDALFSPAMTRSIPPQSTAFLIAVQRSRNAHRSVTTGRIASIDVENGFLYTGIPGQIQSQTRFTISDSTVILDRNGRRINLAALRPGQLVRVTHANFQTASIPPQSPAFYVQQL